MNVYRGSLCESGPTRQNDGDAGARRLANIGCKLNGDWAPADQYDEFRPRIWEKVCQAIDAGHPAIGWDLAEHIISGYDDAGNYLYFDRAGNVQELHHERMGDVEMGFASIEILEPCGSADDRTTVRDALLFAVENATGKHREDPETCSAGIAGYDAWIAALSAPDKPHHGRCAFYANHYGKAREMAVGFLKEAKQRLADKKIDPLFSEAIQHYGGVASNLTTVMELFPVIEGNTDPVQDGPRVQEAIAALTSARNAEVKGLRALAKLALALGAEGIDPEQAGKRHS